MMRRSNDEWLSSLKEAGETQRVALDDLRTYLWRAVFLYLRDRRPDIGHLPTDELRSLADDFAQSALISIQDKLDTFKGNSKFTTWAYRFVINEAAAELRRRHYQHVSLDYLIEEGTAVLHNLAYKKQFDPDLLSERNDMLNQLVDLLKSDLNEKQQLAVYSVHIHGKSIQETAVLLETSPNTLYKILYDARKKLKAGLERRRLSLGDILALFEES